MRVHGRGRRCRCGRGRDLIVPPRLDTHLHPKVVDNATRGRAFDHCFEELCDEGVVTLRGTETRTGTGTYLTPKLFARVLPLHLLRTKQHRALAEYLTLFLHPALRPTNINVSMRIPTPF